MAAIYRQMVIGLRDLRYVSVECQECHSVITLDMTKNSEHQERRGIFVPPVCSACDKPFDTATRNLNSLRRSYQSLLEVADRITFRGELESAEPNFSVSREAV